MKSPEKKKRKVLILGGLGFIGRHMCAEFSSRGDEVYSLGHGSASASELASLGISDWLCSDINFSILIERYRDIVFDIVLHCAGSGKVSFSFENPFEDYERSVTTVAASLEFVRKAQSKMTRFFFISSAAVYGNQNHVLEEISKTQPMSPYGLHKVAGENLCLEYSKYFDIPTSIIRLFSVVGPGLRKQLLWDASHKMMKNNFEFFGTGKEIRDWIHVRDVSKAIVDLSSSNLDVAEVFNLGHHHATTEEVLTQLARAYSCPSPLKFSQVEHLGNPASLTSTHQKIFDRIQWKPVSTLEEIIREYAEWFKRDGKN